MCNNALDAQNTDGKSYNEYRVHENPVELIIMDIMNSIGKIQTQTGEFLQLLIAAGYRILQGV